MHRHIEITVKKDMILLHGIDRELNILQFQYKRLTLLKDREPFIKCTLAEILQQKIEWGSKPLILLLMVLTERLL